MTDINYVLYYILYAFHLSVHQAGESGQCRVTRGQGFYKGSMSMGAVRTVGLGLPFSLTFLLASTEQYCLCCRIKKKYFFLKEVLVLN